MAKETNNNLELWNKVEKTNPKYTKNAKLSGMNITAISPQYQIMNVTEQFGSYGQTWGFKNIELDYSLVNTPFKREKKEGVYPNQKVVGLEDAVMGLVVFKAIFFYPQGEFPIINSISLFTNNEMTKLDDNFAKKVETDALTKAISKLGFNADIFMGKFDDIRYVEEMKKEFNKETTTAKPVEQVTPTKVTNTPATPYTAGKGIGAVGGAMQPNTKFDDKKELDPAKVKALEMFNALDKPTVLKYLIKDAKMKHISIEQFVEAEPIEKIREIYTALAVK